MVNDFVLKPVNPTFINLPGDHSTKPKKPFPRVSLKKGDILKYLKLKTPHFTGYLFVISFYLHDLVKIWMTRQKPKE